MRNAPVVNHINDKLDMGEKHFPSLGKNPPSVHQKPTKAIPGQTISEMIQEKIKQDSSEKLVETDLENMSYEQLAAEGWYVFPLCYWRDIIDKFNKTGKYGNYNFSKIQGFM
jgi:hypothetical protein